jgi:hypothetical protein
MLLHFNSHSELYVGYITLTELYFVGVIVVTLTLRVRQFIYTKFTSFCQQNMMIFLKAFTGLASMWVEEG